jgi:flagellar motor switch protein FliM
MDQNDPLANGGEILSQTEVERLLAQVAEQDSKATIVKNDGEKEAHLKDSIQSFDFRNPVFLTSAELRKLRVEHDEYIQRVAALLSIYFRMEFGLQMSKLQTVPYRAFTETVGSPAHLVLFKVEPLRGVCILDITPRLGLTMVDRLMGGAGHAVAQAHDLSDIESALLDQVVQILISEWCNHWREFQELRPVVLGHENSGQYLQTAHADTVMLVLTLEGRMSDCLEQIQLAFPYGTIEPLVRQMGLKINADTQLANSTAAQKPKWNPELEKARIPVTAEWPALEMTARDLTNLKVGDVLPLEAEVVNNVRLRLASLPKFLGRLGTTGSKWAVEITQTIKS